ncbi:MAG: glycoside hydrolase family 43 protein [Promicromonosporaceae bacterium]|nr:glycoside hydrolase family 43 protein [Promicromonosporaceae bacterium]
MPKLSDIQIRDPYVVAHDDGYYYLFGSTDPDIWKSDGVGFDVYRGVVPGNFTEFEGPFEAFRPGHDFFSHKNFWAPELHEYKGEFYLFATFLPNASATSSCASNSEPQDPGKYFHKGDPTSEFARRGTAILKSAEGIMGPYEPWSDGRVTPPEWETLDGTLHTDDHGTPWLVFCHEWQQIGDGTVEAVELSGDLRATIGEPITLFSSSEAKWSAPLQGRAPGSYVTDGPFVYRNSAGVLKCLWSAFGPDGNYCIGEASSAGDIGGPWTQTDEALFAADGGHGMLFNGPKTPENPDGQRYLAVHTPNATPLERPIFVAVAEDANGTLATTGHIIT